MLETQRAMTSQKMQQHSLASRDQITGVELHRGGESLSHWIDPTHEEDGGHDDVGKVKRDMRTILNSGFDLDVEDVKKAREVADAARMCDQGEREDH